MKTTQDFLKERRAEVERAKRAALDEAARPFDVELQKIDAALKAVGSFTLRSDEPSSVGPTDDASPRAKTKAIGMTLKEMIIAVLRAHRGGMDALSILAAINDRWEIGLARTSLSPQLSRLKAEGKLRLVGKDWSLVQKDEAPDADTSGASSVGVAGSPGGRETVAPTGSTPVASTTPLFTHDQERKEEP
ncbi:hypothetical protein [Brevundimonas poindexterae]|uniref:hypothetical protein n=1 Tax=Brevundimonas poindexterae TaxID=74325 RepID=UPI001CFE89C4|nr:hypothetical protein [Brevundimonas poindexterae]